MDGNELAARAASVGDAPTYSRETASRIAPGSGPSSGRARVIQWVRASPAREHLTLVSIVLVAAFLRLYQFPHVPAGLNQDEADAGYDAYALLLHGTDKWGNHLPVYLPAWGSGQNALLSYLEIPFVRLFGVSVFTIRLLPALLGIASVLVFYAIVKRLHGTPAALLASLFLAVLPWHVMLSRWSLESNLLPFCLLLGVWLVAGGYRANRPGRRIAFALIPFALALYAYAVSIVIVPPLIGLLLLENRAVVRRHARVAAASVAFAGAVAAPLLAFMVVNFVLHREPAILRALPISIPLLPGSRLAQNAGTVPILPYNAVFLLSGFDDGQVYNVLPGFPLLGLLCLPLALLGIWLPARRRSGASRTFLFWLVSCLPLLILTPLNVNRANAFFIPIIALAAVGTVELAELARLARTAATGRAVVRVTVGVTLTYSLVFSLAYFSPANPATHATFTVGLDMALARADAATQPGEPVYVSESIPLNYVYVLFYSRADALDFNRSVSYTVAQGSYRVEAYRGYVFRADSPRLTLRTSYVYIIKRDEQLACASATPLWAGSGWTVGRCVNG